MFDLTNSELRNFAFCFCRNALYFINRRALRFQSPSPEVVLSRKYVILAEPPP